MALLALHVDSAGIVRDSNNAIVYLRGVNSAGTEFNTGLGNQGGLTTGQAWMNACATLLSCNIYRLNINASWWNNNVLMPDGVTTYQSWIAQNITWIKNAGMYAEITATTAFCTGTTSGTSQNFLDSCNSTLGVIDWDNKIFPIFKTFWQNFITPLVVNDPGILYNLSNEPVVSDAITQQKTLLSTVRGIDPSKIVIVDSRNYVPNITPNGSETNYTGSNLIIDWHVYDDSTFWWYQKLSATYNPNADPGTGFPYAQAHGQGVIIGEFNIGGAWNPNGFATEMVRRAFANGIGSEYYNDGNLLGFSPPTLLTQGNQLAPIYAAIAAGPRGWYGQ